MSQSLTTESHPPIAETQSRTLLATKEGCQEVRRKLRILLADEAEEDADVVYIDSFLDAVESRLPHAFSILKDRERKRARRTSLKKERELAAARHTAAV